MIRAETDAYDAFRAVRGIKKDFSEKGGSEMTLITNIEDCRGRKGSY